MDPKSIQSLKTKATALVLILLTYFVYAKSSILFDHTKYEARKMFGFFVISLMLPFLLKYTKKGTENGVYLLFISYIVFGSLYFLYDHSYCNDNAYKVFKQSPRNAVHSSFGKVHSKDFMFTIQSILLEVMIVVILYNLLSPHISKLSISNCLPLKKCLFLAIVCIVAFSVQKLSINHFTLVTWTTFLLSVLLMVSPLINSKNLKWIFVLFSILLLFVHHFVQTNTDYGYVNIGKTIFAGIVVLSIVMTILYSRRKQLGLLFPTFALLSAIAWI